MEHSDIEYDSVPTEESSSFIHRSLIIAEGRKVEICTTRAETKPNLMVLCPIYYREWDNNHVISHLNSYLSQKTPHRVELNYQVNFMIPEKKRTSAMIESAKQMTQFLQDLIQIQSAPDSLESSHIIDKYKDRDNIQRVLQKAQRTKNISISYIDTTQLKPDDFDQLGYTNDTHRMVGGYRTIGFDYARVRDAEIISLTDVDTVPSSRTSLQELIEYYQSSPDALCHFMNIAYYPHAYDTLASSIEVIPGEIDDYRHSGTHSTTQITFTNEAAQTLDRIVGIRDRYSQSFIPGAGFEDCATGRILHIISNGHDTVSPPPHTTIVTSPRADGLWDGKRFKDKSLRYDIFLDDAKHYLKTHTTAPDTILNSTHKEIAKLQRLYRQSVISLIKNNQKYFENAPQSGVVIDFDALERVPPVLQRYAALTNESSISLSSSEYSYLLYILGLSDSHNQTKLSNSMLGLREWLGTPIRPQDVAFRQEDKVDITDIDARHSLLTAVSTSINAQLRQQEIERRNSPSDVKSQRWFERIQNQRSLADNSRSATAPNKRIMASFGKRSQWLVDLMS